LNHPGNPNGYNAGYTDGYDPSVPYFLRHRFASSGTRNDSTETTTYDFMLGLQGQIGIFDLDFGMRRSESHYFSLGENYVVGGLAQQVISDGRYNIYDPYNNPADIVGSFTTTINRDSRTVNKEIFANAAFDLFALPGGVARAVVGGEYREETFADVFDRLSEARQVVGSAGNSAGGARDAMALYFEALLPLVRGLELNLAGRYDDYSDYGSDFSPKVSLRWHPLERWTFRASYGEGFRAPTLSDLTRQANYSATSVTHRPTCDLNGISPDQPCSVEVVSWSVSNQNLESETSKQYGVGVVWDATDWLNIGFDYYQIELTNRISSIGLIAVFNCINGTGTLCPPGLSVFPVGTRIPDISLGLGVTLDPVTGGIINGQYGGANLNKVETDGFDLSLRTAFNFGAWGTLRNRLQMGYVGNYQTDNGESIVGRPGYPRMRGNLSNSWSKGRWNINWNTSYIHGVQSQAWRDIVGDERAGRTTSARIAALPKRLPSWVVHNVQVSWETPWKARLSVGVNNLADKEAVIDPYDGDTFDGSLYNTYGRVPYFRYSQAF